MASMMIWAMVLCALFLILGLEFSLRWNITADPSIILFHRPLHWQIKLPATLLQIPNG
ncbi:MAG: hypothetical protein GY899_00060 [Verrucomicrobiaceae bacterium]|nr:hypothetical protein [Verrucomicrobiaceae bacterium]